MLTLLKWLQLATSLGLIGLGWLVFPGAMVVLATAAVLGYVAAAVMAMLDYRIGIWLAFVCSVLTALFTSYGVYRYVVNGFEFLTGTYGALGGVYLPPYGFVLVAAAAIVVVILHARAWRWMLSGRAGS